MYAPPPFREKDSERLLDWILECAFGTLVSINEEGDILASHVPLDLVRTDGSALLIGHVAKANEQWRSMRSAQQVLAVFRGPDAYVSPRLFDEPDVPTWDYVAVHAYCRPEIVEAPEALRALVTRQVENYEDAHSSDYRVDELPPALLRRQLRRIVGFKLHILRLEGAVKLSQERSPAERRTIAAALAGSERPGDRDVACLMRAVGEGTR